MRRLRAPNQSGARATPRRKPPPHHRFGMLRVLPLIRGRHTDMAGGAAQAPILLSFGHRCSNAQQVSYARPPAHLAYLRSFTAAPHHPIYSPSTGQFTPASSRSNSNSSMFTSMSTAPYGGSRSDHGHYHHTSPNHTDSRPPLTSNNSWQTGSVGSAASSCKCSTVFASQHACSDQCTLQMARCADILALARIHFRRHMSNRDRPPFICIRFLRTRDCIARPLRTTSPSRLQRAQSSTAQHTPPFLHTHSPSPQLSRLHHLHLALSFVRTNSPGQWSSQALVRASLSALRSEVRRRMRSPTWTFCMLCIQHCRPPLLQRSGSLWDMAAVPNRR